MCVDEDRCAVIMRRHRKYVAVWKFFLPRCEKARDALEIFVTAEQNERSHVWRILRIAGRQERESARKTKGNHCNRSGAETSFEPCRRSADCGYRGRVHTIVGEGNEDGRQNCEAAGGQGARKIYEPRIVDAKVMDSGQDDDAMRFYNAGWKIQAARDDTVFGFERDIFG